jgi:hypothetical protein
VVRANGYQGAALWVVGKRRTNAEWVELVQRPFAKGGPQALLRDYAIQQSVADGTFSSIRILTADGMVLVIQ